MKISKKSIAWLLCAANVAAAFGWGQKGHDTTAYIAECHLTPRTLAALDSILDGKSIVYWSNWLDNASHTPYYAYTKTWHYKNVDADQAYDSVPDFPKGDVVTAINAQSEILRNPRASKDEKALALKILVHCMGDLHQPMHLGHASDLGGNQWEVKYFDRKTNLHSVWDSSLPEYAHKWSYTEWQQQVDRVSPEEEAVIVAGTVDDWGRETQAICTEVYATTPKKSQISYYYIAKWAPTIELQFLRGGLRLADILNSIFDENYKL